MEKSRIRHRVERTRNKHSRAICREDTIIIRLAKNLSQAEEREHIQSLLRRMTALVMEEKRKRTVHPFRHLLDGGQSCTVKLASGRRYLFVLRPGPRTRTKQLRNGWMIDVGPGLRRRALHRLLWNLLAQREKARIEAMVRSINAATFRVSVRRVKFCFALTQWGSCSSRGVIMLNAALLFLPPSLLKYVIVHELAHRLVPDHSQRYWDTVRRHMPGFTRPYRTLQQFRLPTL